MSALTPAQGVTLQLPSAPPKPPARKTGANKTGWAAKQIDGDPDPYASVIERSKTAAIDG